VTSPPGTVLGVRGPGEDQRQWISAALFLAACAALHTVLGLGTLMAGGDWTFLWDLELR
jgi:hypothetical protein